MNAKTITRTILLGVVGIAVAGWAVKEFGPAKSASDIAEDKASVTSDVTATPAVVPAASPRPDGVTVINFHGDKRCRTCVGIGTLAKKTIDEEFATEEQAGKVRWEHINIDEPTNAHFVKEYELVSSTVLVTLWKDGREVKWNRLDSVWDYFGDEAKFRTYVAQSLRDLLPQP